MYVYNERRVEAGTFDQCIPHVLLRAFTWSFLRNLSIFLIYSFVYIFHFIRVRIEEVGLHYF